MSSVPVAPPADAASALCVDPARPWALLRVVADAAGVTVSGGRDRQVFWPWQAVADVDVAAVSGVFGTRFAVVLDTPDGARRLMFPRWGLVGFDPGLALDAAAAFRVLRMHARAGA